jgi:hypothetical protein
MPQEGIRRLSLADLDEPLLRRLIDHGEDLFVERKREPPSGSGLGAAVASFANMMGGWLILGIDEHRSGKSLTGTTAVGFDFETNVDPQSHLGQKLRSQVDPLPPFVADRREVDGKTVIVIRVFESSDTPHVVTDTGAIYVRTSSGKTPVSEQRLLLELGRRGQVAKLEASRRLSLGPEGQPLIRAELTTPNELISGTSIAVTVLATPFTVTPHFNSWGVAASGADTCRRLAGELGRRLSVANLDEEDESRARGHTAWWSGGAGIRMSGRAVVDSGGVVGAKLDRGLGDASISLGTIRTRYLDPLVDVVASALEEAEALGRAEWHAIVEFPSTMKIGGVPNPNFHRWHASRELPIPATSAERQQVAASFGRELARQAGEAEYD